MREILFKAKRIDNGEWIEGYYLFCPIQADNKPSLENFTYKHWIVTHNGNPFNVDPSTICQCTGLKDKNGKLIWENDVTLRTSVTGTHKGKIIYSSDGSFCQKDFETTFENLLIHSDSYFEVIGNIFDNPELMNE